MLNQHAAATLRCCRWCIGSEFALTFPLSALEQLCEVRGMAIALAPHTHVQVGSFKRKAEPALHKQPQRYDVQLTNDALQVSTPEYDRIRLANVAQHLLTLDLSLRLRIRSSCTRGVAVAVSACNNCQQNFRVIHCITQPCTLQPQTQLVFCLHLCMLEIMPQMACGSAP